jgi:hypothetical protein
MKDGMAAAHKHGAQLKNLLRKSTGTVLLGGHRVGQSEGVKTHMVSYCKALLDRGFYRVKLGNVVL